jgi:rhodanese-related sulfurtransferase
MKNKLFQVLYLLLFTALFIQFSGCSEDSTTEPEVINESEVLVKYLEANGDFLNSASCPAMISATDLYTGIQASKDWPIIDVRAAADYASGHIQGAVNVPMADILTYYKNNNLQNKEKVVIACYTGQSAGWATAVLRFAGYTNVWDLKFGMCSWNSRFANWANATSNVKATSMVTTNFPKPAAGSLPTLSTGKTAAADILNARVQALLTEGFSASSITRDNLYLDLNNYFIANYWSAEHYNTGHIEGAVQYTPKADLKFDTALKTLPTNKPVVVYCYTGQTSAHVVVFLRMLGYNAKSLSFGTNALNYDTMPGTKWLPTECKEYPVVQ